MHNAHTYRRFVHTHAAVMCFQTGHAAYMHLLHIMQPVLCSPTATDKSCCIHALAEPNHAALLFSPTATDRPCCTHAPAETHAACAVTQLSTCHAALMRMPSSVTHDPVAYAKKSSASSASTALPQAHSRPLRTRKTAARHHRRPAPCPLP
jgi:hypothetical protein